MFANVALERGVQLVRVHLELSGANGETRTYGSECPTQ